MTLKSILIILNILALLGSFCWLIHDKSWEPLITCIGLIASLISLICSNDDSNDKNFSMKQKGGKNSKNYQAKGDINL